MRLGLAILAAAVVLGSSACGSVEEPSISASELFEEYVLSTDVENDRLNSTDSLSRHRVATRYYPPGELLVTLLQTFECDERKPADSLWSNRCDLNDAVRKAARDFGAAEPLGRSILVNRAHGALQLITLYVARGADNKAVLIDHTGQTYTDLEDFRANNNLLTRDDTMLTLRDITSVSGEGEVITVTGRIPVMWPWWLFGGIAVLAAVGTGLVFVVRNRREVGYEAALNAELASEKS
jgi:hypothetical protein